MNDSEIDDNAAKIGNLLLLSENINRKMGNDSFDKKKEKLKNSNLQSVKDFIINYGKYELWTEDLT